MKSPSQRFAVLFHVVLILGFAVLYFLAAKFGLSLAFVHKSATAVWPPTGLSLAVLLLLGRRLWPGVFLGAFLANLTTEGNLATSVAIAAGNTLEAFVGAWLVSRFARDRHAFDDMTGILKFVFLAGIVSPMISATIGVTSLSLGGFAPWGNYGSIWFVWWLGDMLSALIITPLLVIWVTKPLPRLNFKEILECIVIVLFVFVDGVFVFGSYFGERNLPNSYLTIPPLLLASVRFGQAGASLSVFAMSAMALYATLNHLGPFSSTHNPNLGLLMLQGYMGTITLMTLILAAVISERKRAETFNRAVLESAIDCVVTMDHEGRIIEFNQAAEMAFGYSRNEILGKSLAETLVPPAFREAHSAGMRRYLTTGEGPVLGKRIEMTALRADGSEFPVELSILRVPGSEPPIFTSFMRDITERKRTEQELLQGNENLLQSNKNLEQFAYIASHDLQEPLRKIINYSERLKMKQGEEDYLDRIYHASYRMKDVIEDLLQYSRISRMGAERETVDLKEVLADVLSDLEVMITESGAKIEIRSTCVVLANPSQMRHVFQNLITNSIKFVKKGETPRIVIECGAASGEVQIWVSDEGIGFDEKYLNKIFQPFQRLHGREEYSGSGIGLSIVEKIVLNHGGKITAKSEPGRGATFIITIPNKAA